MTDKEFEVVAGGGLLHRRLFLSASLGAAGLALLRARPADAAQQDVPPWMKAPGQGLRPYGERSPYESAVQRIVAPVVGTTGSGSSRSPLEHFEASSRRAGSTSSAITAACPISLLPTIAY